MCKGVTKGQSVLGQDKGYTNQYHFFGFLMKYMGIQIFYTNPFTTSDQTKEPLTWQDGINGQINPFA